MSEIYDTAILGAWSGGDQCSHLCSQSKAEYLMAGQTV